MSGSREPLERLGRISDERAADVLLQELGDSDTPACIAIPRALEQVLTRQGVIRRLCRELGSNNSRRRRASVYALAHLEAFEAGSDAWRLADDPDPEVRLALLHSARALLHDPEPLILYLATDPDGAVKQRAEAWLQSPPGSQAEFDATAGQAEETR